MADRSPKVIEGNKLSEFDKDADNLLVDLGNLNDVDLTTIAPQDDDSISFSSGTWEPKSFIVSPLTFSDNSVLRFDGANNQVQQSDVYILDNGNLGIGTDNPEREVHIFDGNLRIDRTSNSTSLFFVRKDGAGNVQKSFRFDNDSFGVNNGRFSIKDNGTSVGGAATNRLSIENDGRINFETNRAVNAEDPIDQQDLTTKQYVDLRTYEETAQRLTPLLNQAANVFADYLVATFNVPIDGDYNLDWNYIWSHNNTTLDFRSRMVIDEGTANEIIVIRDLRIEPKDAGGGSESIPNTTGGNTNNGTDQRIDSSDGFLIENLSAGSHTFTLQFCSSGANLEPVIYRARVKLKRTNLT